jgi:hypothetical protein
VVTASYTCSCSGSEAGAESHLTSSDFSFKLAQMKLEVVLISAIHPLMKYHRDQQHRVTPTGQ